MNLEHAILVKPQAYEEMGEKATKERVRADRDVLSDIKEGIIDLGTAQLKAKTGYDDKHLPKESPIRPKDFSLDGISFGLVTDVQVINPKYQDVFDEMSIFVKHMTDLWKQGVEMNVMRTYEIEVTRRGKKTLEKAPFLEWKCLMTNMLGYVSNATDLRVTNEIEKIISPKEMKEMKLEELVIPANIAKDFDIEKPGSAKLWYLASRFYDEVTEETIEPVKKEMAKRTGITKKKMPKEKQLYWEQFSKLLYRVISIPQSRRQAGKTIHRLFKIPQKQKPKGSTELPVIARPENYIRLLEDYKPTLEFSLKKWTSLEGNIGELVIFYYGLENNLRVLEEFPFTPQYHLKKEEDQKFICLTTLYERMKALEKNYTKSKLMQVHEIEHII
ncbi:hypothetical protein KY348_00345 [Candidatus Woesearchaeota archaeon]|nr:hypothetical protein [Candidatus Woesearchaeota archaeon]